MKYSWSVVSFVLLVFTYACDNGGDGGEMTVVNPKVSVQKLDFEEGDEDVKAFVRIRLDKQTEELITVYVSSVNGTAEGGVDYMEFEESPVVFQPGDKNKDFQITIFGDTESETDEDFEITIAKTEGNVDIENGTATITITNDDRAQSELVIPTTGFTSSESYPNMDLLWQEDFNEINNDFWTFEIGRGNNGWGNNELQYYQRQNASVVDGNLVIEAREETVGNKYTSSRMISKDKFDFKFGRVDIRAALPKGQGIWPALWMLGANITSQGWPACGEIDIMEIVGHEPSTLHGTAHWSQNSEHASFGKSTHLASGTFNDEFHVFSIIWDETNIRWLLDDVEYNRLDITSPALNEFQKNHFFIMNVAVGGDWPGDPNGTTEFPQRMIVDYIRVFQDK